MVGKLKMHLRCLPQVFWYAERPCAAFSHLKTSSGCNQRPPPVAYRGYRFAHPEDPTSHRWFLHLWRFCEQNLINAEVGLYVKNEELELILFIHFYPASDRNQDGYYELYYYKRFLIPCQILLSTFRKKMLLNRVKWMVSHLDEETWAKSPLAPTSGMPEFLR